MPILTNTHNTDANSQYSISLSMINERESPFEFPDPSTYYILSDAGKNLHNISNESILLNFKKGYFEPKFALDINNASVHSIASSIFNETKPIEGIGKIALENTVLKLGKKETLLSNRY